VGVSTLVPLSVTAFGELAALLVTVSAPERVPAADGVNVMLIVQDAPGLIVPTQLLVEANSGVGMLETCVTLSAADPLLVSVTVCAALVVLMVCVANATALRLSVTAGTGTELPVPESVIAGLVAALDATVRVAVRAPVALGVKVADSVQFPPGAIVTAVALTQLPEGENSAALVPLLVIAEIVRFPEPVFVSVTFVGLDVAAVEPTSVVPNVNEVPEAEMTGADVAAAGFAM